MERFDVAIVGGGIVGTAAAFFAARAGAKTVVFDRGDRGRATDAAAGIVSAETYGGPSSDWFEFSLAAADSYPDLIAEIRSDDDPDCGYGRCGMLVIASGDDELPRFEEALSRIRDRQRAGRLPDRTELAEVSLGEARSFLPNLGNLKRAIYSRRASRVDGRRLAAAMRRAAERAGAEFRAESVDSFDVRGDRIAAGVTASGEFASEQWVVAGGAWTPELAMQVGLLVPIAPQRGQLVHLRGAGIDPRGWPIVEGFRGHYLVPWPDGRLVAGATRETGSGFTVEATPMGIAKVLDEAVRVIPALDDSDLIDVRVGLRPLTADGLPVIGRVPSTKNLILASGHGPHGLQLGPYTGKVVADELVGRPSAIPTAFSPTRTFK